jgi:ABC-type lipoprotein export system ATPase subunit
LKLEDDEAPSNVAFSSNSRPYTADEPTNHLDVMNVKWVEEYLLNLKNVTCIIVSHDTGRGLHSSTSQLNLSRF